MVLIDNKIFLYGRIMMEYRKKSFLSLFLCVLMILSLPVMAYAEEQPFWNVSASGHTYLYQNENGGLTRVILPVSQWKEKIYIEDYDASLNLQAKHEIAGELSLFGCFFSGAQYNYMVFGQENPDEEDSVEVVRVVKYSKNWERLGHASIYGANTKTPFKHGSCRCAESGGMLYIHTCHEMYKTEDKLNHQANMTLAIRESDMTATYLGTRIASISSGYVSHSFDQYVIADQEGNIVCLDLGDAYPRAVVLTRYNGKAGSEETLGSDVSNVNIQEINGKTGDNYTGVSIGGFAETTGGYVTAYSYNGADRNAAQSVYFAYTDKGSLNTRVAKLAESTPASFIRLVPNGIAGGYIFWIDTASKILYYTSYAADGSTGEVRSANIGMDGAGNMITKPICYNGSAVWSEGVRTNIKSSSEYDIAVNFYLLNDTGLHTVTLPATYPYTRPVFPEYAPSAAQGTASLDAVLPDMSQLTVWTSPVNMKVISDASVVDVEGRYLGTISKGSSIGVTGQCPGYYQVNYGAKRSFLPQNVLSGK